MITRGCNGVGQFAKDVFAVVMNLAGFAVEKLGRANDLSAESCADGLVAKADAQDRKLSCETFYELHGDARLLRGAGARRNHDTFWLAARNLLNGDLVVAMDFDCATEFPEILGKVVGE